MFFSFLSLAYSVAGLDFCSSLIRSLYRVLPHSHPLPHPPFLPWWRALNESRSKEAELNERAVVRQGMSPSGSVIVMLALSTSQLYVFVFLQVVWWWARSWQFGTETQRVRISLIPSPPQLSVRVVWTRLVLQGMIAVVEDSDKSLITTSCIFESKETYTLCVCMYSAWTVYQELSVPVTNRAESPTAKPGTSAMHGWQNAFVKTSLRCIVSVAFVPEEIVNTVIHTHTHTHTRTSSSGVADSIQGVLERHQKMQDEIAEDMIRMARSLRDNSLMAKDIIIGDNKVGEDRWKS